MKIQKTDNNKSVTEIPSSLEKGTNSTDLEESNKASKSSSPSSISILNDDSREKSTAVQVPEVHDGMNQPNYNSSLCEALLTADDHRPVPVESQEGGMVEPLPVQTLEGDEKEEACNIDETAIVEESNNLHHTQEINLESDNVAKIDTENPQTNSPNEIPNEILDDEQPIKSFEDMEHISYESSPFSDAVEYNEDIETSQFENLEEDKTVQIVDESCISQEDSKPEEIFNNDSEGNLNDSQSSTVDVSPEQIYESPSPSTELQCPKYDIPISEESNQNTTIQEATEDVIDTSASSDNKTEIKEEYTGTCSQDCVADINEQHNLTESETFSQEEHVQNNQDLNQAEPENQTVANVDAIESSPTLSPVLEKAAQEVSTDTETLLNEESNEIVEPESDFENIIDSPIKENDGDSNIIINENEDATLLTENASSAELEQVVTDNVTPVKIENVAVDNQDSKKLPNSSEGNFQTESPASASPKTSPISQIESTTSTDDKDTDVFENKRD
ncbi:neurobeachin [Caerostris extrusa]|uniref:Neurobeachin n=1 Tax=Caerostris extrusa TaxID=172846 RepID=A0AAV4WHF5_CAEEX|nr:neurobeachin [Caerostris extrusa]